MSHEPVSDVKLETLYENLCNGVEILHQQSEAQRGLARVLFYALSSFLVERGGMENLAMARTGRNPMRDTTNERVLSGMLFWLEGTEKPPLGTLPVGAFLCITPVVLHAPEGPPHASTRPATRSLTPERTLVAG